jgi:hypothetical protein
MVVSVCGIKSWEDMVGVLCVGILLTLENAEDATVKVLPRYPDNATLSV